MGASGCRGKEQRSYSPRFHGVQGVPQKALSLDQAGQRTAVDRDSLLGAQPCGSERDWVTSLISGRDVGAQGDLAGWGWRRRGLLGGCCVGPEGLLGLLPCGVALCIRTGRGGQQTRPVVALGKACFHFWFLLACCEVGTRRGREPHFRPCWGRVPGAVLGAVTLFCAVSRANSDVHVTL